MDGRRPGAPALGRRALRGTFAVVAAALVVTSPGVAAAAPPGGLTPGHGDLVPVVNCVVKGTQGRATVVFGYRNTGTATEHEKVGSANRVTPAAYDGGQPTKFSSGTRDGAFSVSVTSPTVSWTVRGRTATATVGVTSACPREITMPADGNDTAPAFALVAAAAVGALLIRRARRRLSGGKTTSYTEDGNA